MAMHKVGASKSGSAEEQASKAERLVAFSQERAEALTLHRDWFVHDMLRLGKGAARWAVEGWEWEEPDWESDPNKWPHVAKILWLFIRVQRHAHDQTYLAAFKDRPERCGMCEPGGHPYLCVWCDEHAAELDMRSVQALAKALFGKGETQNEVPVIGHTPPMLLQAAQAGENYL